MHIIKQGNVRGAKEPAGTIKDYKLSAFCISLPVAEGMLLCHACTGELALLTEQEYQAVLSGEPLDEDWALRLAQRQFLRGFREDEYAEVDAQRKNAHPKTEEQCPITSFTILPTSRCNARCFYCYEKGITPQNMSPETADAVADFIIRSSKGQSVHLGWFGGEPTVAHPIITRICRRLEENQVSFRSGMISNGLLLDEALIHTAVTCWKLQHIQITIDGTEAVYNATKNYKGNPENPFLTVLAHIDALQAANVRVSIRINLGLHNYDDSLVLIDQLARRFRGKKGIRAYVHEIDNVYDDDQYLELMARTNALNRKLVDHQLQELPALPALRLHSCMADSQDSVLINPEGNLGKCEHFVFEKLHGSIYHSEKDYRVLDEWEEPMRFPQCGQCPLYAACLRLKLCNGGGYFCVDGIIEEKILQIQDTMRKLYHHWKKQRERFLEKSVFVLSRRFELHREAGELSAVFSGSDTEKGEIAIPVNQTSLDILVFLQETHTFRDITEMLREKYDTSSFSLEEIVEDYLTSLIRAGCVKQRDSE